MRRIAVGLIVLIAAVLPVAPATGQSGLSTSSMSSGVTAEQMAQSLVGGDVAVSNVVYNGSPDAGGTFANGDTIVGFSTGVVLSTGFLGDLPGPNDSSSTTGETNSPGDPQLGALAADEYGSGETFEAAILEFDIVTSANGITFEYVFGSEEYDEYVNTQFNDVFAFTVNGQNCATVAAEPVSVNNVNAGNPNDGTPATNPDLYIRNTRESGAPLNLELDGITSVLPCEAAVVPGQLNHLRLAIADVGDNQLDSAVFIRSGSLITEQISAFGPDGDPATTEIADFSNGDNFGLGASLSRFADAGSATYAGTIAAEYAVVARNDEFADSLAGAPLSSRGPLLFNNRDFLNPAVASEIERVLPAGAKVYILGGEAALGSGVETALRDRGFEVIRLSGEDRIETAVEVADEVVRLFGRPDRVLIARAFGEAGNPTAAWADSVTGGAFAAEVEIPILITPTESLHPAVEAWIDNNVPERTVVLGGEAAISSAVEDQLPNAQRVSGSDRADTARAIAEELWGVDPDVSRTVLIANGFRPDGWIFGLGAAGLASELNAPILLVQDAAVPPPTETLVSSCGEPAIESLVLGSERVIGPEVVSALDALDGGGCGP